MATDLIHDELDMGLLFTSFKSDIPGHSVSYLIPILRYIAWLAAPHDILGVWDSRKTLHPTFLSWLKNMMNALSTLIIRLFKLAHAAPQEYQPQLNRQVAASRTGFK